jgi:hypothetical protein
MLPSSMEGQSGRLGRRSDSRLTMYCQTTIHDLSARITRDSPEERYSMCPFARVPRDSPEERYIWFTLCVAERRDTLLRDAADDGWADQSSQPYW